MRPALRLLIALCVTSATALGLPGPAQAQSSGSVTAQPSAEAWYRTVSTCTLPVGCPPEQPPSPYSADTLHVGAALGQEESRIVLQLDLTALPAGTKPAGGQLRLPVAGGPQDGTFLPDSATIRACPVTTTVSDADGSFEAPPDADCDAASTEAVFVPATDDTSAAFTVDLSALATSWQSSSAPGALALLPTEEIAPPETWHVAVSNRNRVGEDVKKITAAITYVSATVDDLDPPPFVPAPIDSDLGEISTFTLPESFDTGTSLDAPVAAPQPEPGPVAAAPAPQTAPTQQIAPVAFVDGSFRYPAVFLLPLLFAAGAAWIGRALTRDLVSVPGRFAS